MRFKNNQLRFEASSLGVHIYVEYEFRYPSYAITSHGLEPIEEIKYIKNHLEKFSSIFINEFNGYYGPDKLVYFDIMEGTEKVEEWLDSLMLLNELENYNG